MSVPALPLERLRTRLGLSAKVFLLIALLLSSVSGVVGALQQRLLIADSDRRENARLQGYPALFEALLQQTREKLALQAAQVAVTLDARAPEAWHREDVRAALLANLESVLIFDADGRRLARFAVEEPEPLGGETWIAEAVDAVRRNARPVSRLQCRPQCLHYVFAPVLDARGHELVFGLAHDLAEILPPFRQLGGADVALLAHEPAAGAQRLFSRRLVAVTNAPVLAPVLARLAASDADPPTLEAPARADVGGRKLRLAAHPLVESADGDGVEALFIQDGTEAHVSIARTVLRTGAVAVVGLLLSVGVLFALLTPPMRRLRRVTGALPLLASQQFDEARTRMQPRRRARCLTDEIDVLGDTALWLTDRLQRLDHAEAASEAKSRFLAAMSHEIRTPMNGVIGTLELLEHTGLRADQQESVKVILGSAHALLRVIDDILDFSKVEAGLLDIERVPVDVAQVVEDTVQTLAPALRSKPVRLVAYVDPALPEAVLGDPVRLRQILFNLCGNAIKFTAQGRVVVRAEPVADRGGVIRFSVRDTGPGVPAAAQATLFQPFRQGDASTRRRYGGTGLGLSISRGLVERMGGTIGFSSQPGAGSEFWFELPLPAEREAPADTRLSGHSVEVRLADPDEAAAVAAYARAAGARLGADPGGIVVEEDRAQSAAVVLRRHGGVIATLARPLQRAAVLHALAQERAAPEAVPTRADSAPRPRSADRILVAEDHPVNQRVLRAQLDRLGYAADVVDNGRAALDALAARSYQLLITDLEMPVLDGFELIRAVRRLEAARAAPRLPIVALSANVLQDEAARCKDAGADDYLSKPVGLELLDACLQRRLAAGAAAAPPIDLASLRMWIGDDPQLTREVLNDFLRINGPLFAELQAVGLGGPSDQVRRLAHKLRGSATTAGARTLGACLDAIERAAAARQAEALSAALAPAGAAFAAAKSWIEREYPSAAA